MDHSRTTLLVAVAALLLAPLLLLPAPAAAARTAAIPSDFNGDGYADLAIGVQSEGVGSKVRAGAVNVLYGSQTGLTAVGDQYWTQDTAGVKGQCDGSSSGDYGYGDEFGAALASGDFNRDGYADLAIGARYDRIGASRVRAGAVNVLYGSQGGLTAAGDQLWSQANLPGIPEKGDAFGAALAAGDFDQDGYWDLAVGVPGDQFVIGLRGGLGGLVSADAKVLRPAAAAPDAGGVLSYGSALEPGDLTGDGYPDLAVTGMGADQAFVDVFHGSSSGLTGARGQRLLEALARLEAAEPGAFGRSLAIGDFDADGFGDLAIGSPHWEECDWPGQVVVVPGSAQGVVPASRQVLPPFAGDNGTQYGCGFGRALASGHLDADGYADLAVSTVVYDSAESAGAVYVAAGGASGLAGSAPRRWTQDSTGIPGVSERDDRFGWSLAAADFGRSARDDLAIGVPGESTTGGQWELGRVTVVYGTAIGLDGAHAQSWAQSSDGVRGTGEPWDQFGSVLAP